MNKVIGYTLSYADRYYQAPDKGMTFSRCAAHVFKDTEEVTQFLSTFSNTKGVRVRPVLGDNKVKPEVIGYQLRIVFNDTFCGYYQRLGRGLTFDRSKAHAFSKQELACCNLRDPEVERRVRPVYRKHTRPVAGYIIRSKSGFTYLLNFDKGFTSERSLAYVFTKKELLSKKAVFVRRESFKKSYELVVVYA